MESCSAKENKCVASRLSVPSANPYVRSSHEAARISQQQHGRTTQLVQIAETIYRGLLLPTLFHPVNHHCPHDGGRRDVPQRHRVNPPNV